MFLEVKVPRIGVNEDYVELVEWYVDDGDFVEEEFPLCLVESTKASFEIEAERKGIVKRLVEEGKKVLIQDTICIIADTLEELEGFLKEHNKDENPCETEVTATRKAIELAKKLGVDLKKISKKGVIKSKDVEQIYKEMQSEIILEDSPSSERESGKDIQTFLPGSES